MYTVEPSEINIKKNNLSLISVSDFLACPTSPKPEILEDRETSTLSLFFPTSISLKNWDSGTRVGRTRPQHICYSHWANGAQNGVISIGQWGGFNHEKGPIWKLKKRELLLPL